MSPASETGLKIRTTIYVVLPFIATIIAIVLLWNRYVFPSDLILFAAFLIPTALGVTIGFHRMLTHQSFQANPVLKALLLICGVMSIQGAPDEWAATHTRHHALSDKEGDPHSPLEGFWHAHMGWMFSLRNSATAAEYAPHLLQDPVVRFVSRTWVLWTLVSIILPWMLGGWTGLIWGGGVRIFIANHIVWSVNSVCHCFGRRPFETSDESRNEWVVGLLAFGEGWHNNHHAFPRHAFHGMRWWQFDLSGYLIRLFEAMGLAWDVQRVKEEAVEAKMLKSQTLRESLQELKLQLGESIANAKEELQQVMALADTYPLPMEMAPSLRKRARAIGKEARRKLERIRAASHHVSLRKPTLLSYKLEIQEVVAGAKRRIWREYRRYAPVASM